jgi:hypothetical protein
MLDFGREGERKKRRERERNGYVREEDKVPSIMILVF